MHRATSILKKMMTADKKRVLFIASILKCFDGKGGGVREKPNHTMARSLVLYSVNHSILSKCTHCLHVWCNINKISFPSCVANHDRRWNAIKVIRMPQLQSYLLFSCVQTAKRKRCAAANLSTISKALLPILHSLTFGNFAERPNNFWSCVKM